MALIIADGSSAHLRATVSAQSLPFTLAGIFRKGSLTGIENAFISAGQANPATDMEFLSIRDTDANEAQATLFSGGSAYNYTLSPGLDDTLYTPVVATFDTDEIVLYMPGSTGTALPVSLAPVVYDYLTIGHAANQNNDGACVNCGIEHASFWTGLLDSTEIAAYLAQTSNPIEIATANLLSYLPLVEDLTADHGSVSWVATGLETPTFETSGYTFPAPTYNVTYLSTNATGGTVPVDSTEYESGDTVTVAGNTGSLVRTNYLFGGWSLTNGGEAVGSFVITEDTDLYPLWVPTYAITYHANNATGGTVPVDSNRYEADDSVTLLGNTGSLVREDYSYTGWNTLANGSGAHYEGGGTLQIQDNTTLYAEWEAGPYTLTYNANGATGGTAPVDGDSPYANGTDATIFGNTGNLVKTGNIFIGWRLFPSTGAVYEAGDTLNIVKNNVLYACWIPKNGAFGGGSTSPFGTSVWGD